MKGEGFAPAKVNLTLHITGRRPDGYHELDSLVVFADVGDRITVSPAAEYTLEAAGPMAAGVPVDDRNLVMRAARLIGVPCRITLEKHLPHAAGLGGGSADAATALKALARLSGREVPEALTLGADVPVCLAGPGAMRMRGIGERLDPVAMPALHAVLVSPDCAVPTGAVFGALAQVGNAPMPELPKEGWLEGLAMQRNDLEIPAMQVQPVIGEVLDMIAATEGCQLARMSGSGGTCFGLYADAASAKAAADKIAKPKPNWWVRATVLNGG